MGAKSNQRQWSEDDFSQTGNGGYKRALTSCIIQTMTERTRRLVGIQCILDKMKMIL